MSFNMAISHHPRVLRIINLARQGFYRLFPPMCLLCLHPTHRRRNLCLPCQEEVPSLAHSCRKCAQFLHGARLTPLCSDCIKDNPPFERTFALGPYLEPFPTLITGLKFKGNLLFARALGELMADAISNDWYRGEPLPEAIIPVPLHLLRLGERGFNQALEIARPVKHLLGIPIDWRQVERVKPTKPQSDLRKEQRIRNVSGAFQLCGDMPYQHIAVLDDVVTTGETMRVLCRELKQGGVARIDVWCCARR